MATEEQIRGLAYLIWDREGKPEGRAQEHYFRAKQFLEYKELLSAAGEPDLASIKGMMQTSDRTAWYIFYLSFAFAGMAVGVSLSLLNPPLAIGGINSTSWGTILSLMSLIVVVVAGVRHEPGHFHLRLSRVAFWIMLGGTLLLAVGSILATLKAGAVAVVLQLGSLLIFGVGLLLSNMAKKSYQENQVRTD